jgi:hypothetical protein
MTALLVGNGTAKPATNEAIDKSMIIPRMVHTAIFSSGGDLRSCTLSEQQGNNFAPFLLVLCTVV